MDLPYRRARPQRHPLSRYLVRVPVGLAHVPQVTSRWKEGPRLALAKTHDEIVGKAQRELDDGEGRIGDTGAREHTAAADVQILEPVDAAIPVDHARLGIVAHAGGAHVV